MTDREYEGWKLDDVIQDIAKRLRELEAAVQAMQQIHRRAELE